MSNGEYAGWTNRETWAVNLWLSSEQPMYDYVMEIVEELRESGMPKKDMKYELADRLKDFIEEDNPLADEASVYSDLLGGALSEVNWDEIAEKILAE